MFNRLTDVLTGGRLLPYANQNNLGPRRYVFGGFRWRWTRCSCPFCLIRSLWALFGDHFFQNFKPNFKLNFKPNFKLNFKVNICETYFFHNFAAKNYSEKKMKAAKKTYFLWFLFIRFLLFIKSVFTRSRYISIT